MQQMDQRFHWSRRFQKHGTDGQRRFQLMVESLQMTLLFILTEQRIRTFVAGAVVSKSDNPS
jgi:hypothetical protein